MSPKILNILLVIFPVVLFVFVIQPIYTGLVGIGGIWAPANSIKALRVLDRQYTATLAQIDTIEKDAEALNKDYTSLDPEIGKKVNTLLSDTVDPIKLRNEVVNIATKSGIAIQSLDVKRDKASSLGRNYYVVSFSLKTRYTPFKKLVESFDRNMRFYNLEAISLSRKNEEDAVGDTTTQLTDKDALDVSVRFRVYQMK